MGPPYGIRPATGERSDGSREAKVHPQDRNRRGQQIEERNAVIVACALGGICKNNDEGRYVNGTIRRLPFARLLSYTGHKAHGASIDLRLIEEYDASKNVQPL